MCLTAATVAMVAAWVYTKPAYQAFSIAEQVRSVRPAVVHVEKVGVCQGSGCIISPDGIVFTAKHVTDGEGGTYKVTLDDGTVYGAKYAIEDTENDVAFLKLDLPPGTKLPYVELGGESEVCRPGDGVFIMGSPLGSDNFNSVSFGILSYSARNLNTRPGWEQYDKYDWHVMMQTTSPAFPGNSGGPVFDMQGRAIGVLVAGQAETLNFAVPVARFYETIDTVEMWFALCRFDVVEDKPAVEEWYEAWNATIRLR